jgi:hypothetical protein
MLRRYALCGIMERISAVYRFKGFDSAMCGDNMSALEAVVNAWMEEEHPRIRHCCQTMRGEHILLSFVYEDSHELEQRVAAQAQFRHPGLGIYEGEYEQPPTNPHIPAVPPPMH